MLHDSFTTKFFSPSEPTKEGEAMNTKQTNLQAGVEQCIDSSVRHTKIVKQFLFAEPRIDSVSALVSELQERRRRWPEQSHAAANYVVSHEDTIKMHINLYLGHMAKEFCSGDIQALVLDASDMGTSLVFDIMGIHKIVVPNYYNKSTEFETMRSRMPSVASLPISVEDYIDIWSSTAGDDEYQAKIIKKTESYEFDDGDAAHHIQQLEQLGIGERPAKFDVVYLDFCGAFNKDTKKSVNQLVKIPDAQPTIIAITGSIMGTHKKGSTSTKQIANITKFMLKHGYVMDQTFLYNRHVHHSRVAPGVEIGRTILEKNDQVKAKHPEHGRKYFKGTIQRKLKNNRYSVRFNDERKIDGRNVVVTDTQSVHRSDISNRGGTNMFFMSFVRTPAAKFQSWNRKFTKCNGRACKIQKEHQYCLYHEAGDARSFCNRLLQDFYIMSDKMIDTDDDFETMMGEDVPMTYEGILEHTDFIQSTERALFKLQEGDWQTYDAKDLQDYIATTGNIAYNGRRKYVLDIGDQQLFVRTECVFDKTIAFSLEGFRGRSYSSLLGLHVSGVIYNIECLFNDTKTDAKKALIFIPKSLFQSFLGGKQEEGESKEEEEEEEEEEQEGESKEEEEEEEEEEPVHGDDIPPYAEPKVGDRIMFEWNKEKNEYYPGEIKKISPKGKDVRVNWDDGSQDTLNGSVFKREKYGRRWWLLPKDSVDELEQSMKKLDLAAKERRYPKRHRPPVNYEEKEEQSGYQKGEEIIIGGRKATVQQRRGKTVYYTFDDTGKTGKLKL